jgi:hypothetical protein
MGKREDKYLFMITVERTNSDNKDFQKLVRQFIVALQTLKTYADFTVATEKL